MGDDAQSKKASPDKLDDDLASDWESAFQADDFSFSPKEGEDDFFLGDETDFTSATSSPYDFTPPSDKELEDLPDLDETAFTPDAAEDEEEPEPTADLDKSPGGTLPARLLTLYHTGKLRLQLLSRKQQILAGAAVVALLLLPLLIPDSEEAPTTSNGAAHVTGATTGATSGAQKTTSPPSGALPPADLDVQEKIRVKWQFPAFLVPAPEREDTPRKANFVQTDITLILLLAAGEKPPAEKELLVRDIIYQFYSNQPLSELQRFALARGDMNRSLRAWIEQQWPEAPVEAIVFNRYQIL
ncbi:MAG: flagellar basal body-associated FliL family protein [Desulfobulbaceae bacterium]|nr:flagellar basal body-associated FliL family protein [Desulfobulbaceae bacterium]